MASFVQDMGINHSRSYIFVPHQLLDGSDVIPGLKQIGGKRMSEGVAANALDYPGFANGFLYSPLGNGLVDVVAALLAGLDVLPSILLGKDPLSASPPEHWDTCDPRHWAFEPVPTLRSGLSRETT